jgi:hypothetical protein
MGSTYSYLSVMRLGEVERPNGIRFNWRPFHLLIILQEMIRSSQFRNHPPGSMGKREQSTILKTDERSIHLELGHERRFNR